MYARSDPLNARSDQTTSTVSNNPQCRDTNDRHPAPDPPKREYYQYLSIFQKEIWHVRAVELWSRLGSGRCAGWDELKGGEFFSEDRFARVKPRLDFCQDIAEREMVQPF